MGSQYHLLMVFFPLQGHINPSFQLAKNLVRNGAKVTLATTTSGLHKIKKSLPDLKGLSFASFYDDHKEEEEEDGSQTDRIRAFENQIAELRCKGPQNLTKLLRELSARGDPVNLLVYSILLPWAAGVARDLHLPSAFFYNQCATVLAIYHRFFNIRDRVGEMIDYSSFSIQLSGLPLFSSSDLPTFIFPHSPLSNIIISLMHQHIQVVEEDPSSIVLVNTFQQLEQESIELAKANSVNIVSVGPLIPSAFSDGIDQTDRSFGGDLFSAKSEDNYFEWLDSKAERSVIYVSFGSLAVLTKEQNEEILDALVESRRPFLWVLRSSADRSTREEDEQVKKMVDEKGDGITVPWCSQVQVLSHRSVGCFLTHCGWNSTLESMVCGVPIIGCPQLSDQTTNAKMVEEVWGIGVRARSIQRGEIKRCLSGVMGIKGERIRENAGKLRGLGIEAVKDGGSTYNNLKRLAHGDDLNNRTKRKT